MSYFFIDFENVKSEGLSGLLQLPETDCIFLFWSNHEDKLRIDLAEKLLTCKAQLRFFRATTGGKNALDHQLSSYVGYLMGTSSETQYYIVSNDCGYKFLVDFWRRQRPEVSMKMISSIKAILPPPAPVQEAAAQAAQPAEQSAPAKTAPQPAPAPQAVQPQQEAEAAPAQEETPAPRENTRRRSRSRRARVRRENAAPAERTEAPAMEAKPEAQPAPVNTQPEPAPLKGRQEPVQAKPHAEPPAETAPEKAAQPKAHSAPSPVKSLTQLTRENILSVLPEAKDSPWLDDLARYINTSKNKKELYTATVKKLGQEQGRSVYHKIKNLTAAQ